MFFCLCLYCASHLLFCCLRPLSNFCVSAGDKRCSLWKFWSQKRKERSYELSGNEIESCLSAHDEFSCVFYSKGGMCRVEDLQIQTSDKHNLCKSPPLTLQFSGSPGFLVSLHRTYLQTQIQKAVIFFLLHICLLYSELRLLPHLSSSLPFPSPLVIIPCSNRDYSATPLPPCFTPNIPTLSPQLLHTSRAINSRDVLVLKACKTERPVSKRPPSLFSTEMGHLVRNPIKHIPHKVGLFGYFSLDMASLKSYYLFKVPHVTPFRQCQCHI